MANVIIMSGLPGSGKSTFAKAMQDKHGHVIVSADHYFERDGEYKFDPSKLSEAHQECFRMFVSALHSGKDVIVDNTNLSAWEVSPYMMYAEAYNHDVKIVRVGKGVLYEKMLKRQAHGVPEVTFWYMVRSWENPDFLPWWRVEEPLPFLGG